jgi:DNA-binding response OmpR family regulator
MPSSPPPALQPRILVVEDDTASRTALAQCLREEHYTVSEAADGVAGLELAGREAPQLVILDLMLPKLDGIHVLEKLRQSSAVPVIVVSARRGENDRVEALNLGADDYLTKPFTVRELLARIRAVLRRSENEVTTLITIGDVAIDTASKTASRNGERIPLTPMEFDVLLYLARRRGKLVPRDLLHKVIHPEHAQDIGNTSNVSNVIDVFVLRLRKKLGRGLITTRRGQGFIIDA